MSAHQKRFLMMHNNLSKPPPPQKKNGNSNSRCWYRQSGPLTITPPQRDYLYDTIKLYKVYELTLLYYNYWNSLGEYQLTMLLPTVWSANHYATAT